MTSNKKPMFVVPNRIFNQFVYFTLLRGNNKSNEDSRFYEGFIKRGILLDDYLEITS